MGFQDASDKSDGLTDNLFNRYVIETKSTAPCQCNEIKIAKPIIYESTLTTVLKKSANYLHQSRIHYGSWISLSLFTIASTPRLKNQKIEQEFPSKFDKKDVTLKLIAIINFENGNHFTLAFKDPMFKKKLYKSWSYYNSFGQILKNMETLIFI